MVSGPVVGVGSVVLFGFVFGGGCSVVPVGGGDGSGPVGSDVSGGVEIEPGSSGAVVGVTGSVDPIVAAVVSAVTVVGGGVTFAALAGAVTTVVAGGRSTGAAVVVVVDDGGRRVATVTGRAGNVATSTGGTVTATNAGGSRRDITSHINPPAMSVAAATSTPAATAPTLSTRVGIPAAS